MSVVYFKINSIKAQLLLYKTIFLVGLKRANLIKTTQKVKKYPNNFEQLIFIVKYIIFQFLTNINITIA